MGLIEWLMRQNSTMFQVPDVVCKDVLVSASANTNHWQKSVCDASTATGTHSLTTMAPSLTYMAGQSEGSDLDQLVPDLPKGPLDHYRASASFNWKQMKAYIDPPDIIAFKVSVLLCGNKG